MTQEKSQLGVFLGNNSLYFVKTQGVDPTQIFNVHYGDIVFSTTEDDSSQDQTVEIATLIQNSFTYNNINQNNANLSLPTKDIIFRSFIIPWMQPNEIQGVIEFEISKYIPFALEDLSYSYHPLTIVKEDTKRIRIIFIATKNSTLSKYTTLLENSAIKVGAIEPSCLSLIRTLSNNSLISKDETLAIIAKSQNMGEIIIVDQGIPQFVREFQLKTSQTEEDENDLYSTMTKLLNEIRISLDYFSRQDDQLEVSKIFLLTPKKFEQLSTKLGEELKIPTTNIDATSILKNENIDETEYLNAYGVGLIGSAPSFCNIDLSKGKPDDISFGYAATDKAINFKVPLTIAFICIPILILSFILSFQLLNIKKKEIESLKTSLGTRQNASTDKLKKQTSELRLKLNVFYNIRSESDIAFYLALIPDLLPEGTWLKDINFNYVNPNSKSDKKSKVKGKNADLSQLNISISGYAYLENTKEQFLLANKLLSTLKNNQDLAKNFEDIDLETVKTVNYGEYVVTYFEISLE